MWRYLTTENRRLSKLSIEFMWVIFFDLLNKLFLTSNCYVIAQIYCVRWNPSGDMLASASHDQTVALLDFKAGKKLYTGKTSDGSTFHVWLMKTVLYLKLDPAMSVCFLWQRIKVNNYAKRNQQEIIWENSHWSQAFHILIYRSCLL